MQRSGAGTRWEAGCTTARTHRISGPAATPSAEVVAYHLVFPSKNKSYLLPQSAVTGCHVFNYSQIIFSKTGNLIYYIILNEEGGQAHDCGEGNSESGLVEWESPP